MSKLHVDILKRVRKAIASGDSRYICCECTHVAFEVNQTGVHDAANQIRRGIEQDLQGPYTYETWLITKRYLTRDNYDTPENRRKALAGRLAWIDALIVYWKDKP